MKKIISIICILFLVSCKKNKEDGISNNVNVEISEFSIDHLWKGDSSVSDSNFVNQISKTCSISDLFGRSVKQTRKDYEKCVLSKINFNYEKLNSLEGKVLIGGNNKINLFIKKTIPKNENNADIYFEITLFSYQNDSLIDSLIIYKSVNYSEAFVADKKYYYFKKNRIFLLDITEDETGTKFEKWEVYEVDLKLGTFKLVASKVEKEDIKNQSSVTIDLAKWGGVYWLYPFSLDSEIKGNYYLNIFEEDFSFGLSGGQESFQDNIYPKEIDNELYLFEDKNEKLKENSIAKIKKVGDQFYIKSSRIKLQRKDINKTTDGYPFNWRKTIEEVPDN